MSSAEFPKDMTRAADDALRFHASQHDTAILQLAELEAVFAGPSAQDHGDLLTTSPTEKTPDQIDYESMSKIQLFKELSSLDVNVRANPDLAHYMDEIFPDGYAKAEPSLRLFSWNAFKSDVTRTEQSSADKGVMEAMEYQKRQLDNRKIQAAKAIWSEQATVVLVSELEAQTSANFQLDMEAAYIENDSRAALRRSEVVRQRAVREIKTFLDEDEFVAACAAANYNVSDIAAGKPEYAVYTLRTLLNEWEKNGVLLPKHDEPEAPQTPIALVAVKKALQDHKRRVKPTAELSAAEIVIPIVEPVQAVSAPVAPTVPVSDFSMTAGARAFAELASPASIKAINVSALDGEVTRRFTIDDRQEIR